MPADSRCIFFHCGDDSARMTDLLDAVDDLFLLYSADYFVVVFRGKIIKYG